MQPYKNLSGQSTIVMYDIGGDFIDVMFKTPAKDGSTIYRYSYTSAGSASIEHMKDLARQGQGLNSFITTMVRDLYESKR
jgi:hypothetical protein